MAEKDKKNNRVSDKKRTFDEKPVGKKPCSVMGKCGGCKWLSLSY